MKIIHVFLCLQLSIISLLGVFHFHENNSLAVQAQYHTYGEGGSQKFEEGGHGVTEMWYHIFFFTLVNLGEKRKIKRNRWCFFTFKCNKLYAFALIKWMHNTISN